MSVAEMVRRLAATGATPEAIAIAVEAVEAEQNKDVERRSKRAAARKRQRQERDMAATVARHGGDKGATVADSPPPAAPPKDNNQTPHTTPSKTDDIERARRPHRMPRDFRLTQADRQFARDMGWSEAEIDDGETELVDYWSNPSLPASKALKTDWSAVWRNRVRDMGRRRGRQKAPGPPHLRPVRTAPQNPWLREGGLLDQPDDQNRPGPGADHGFAGSRDPEVLQPDRGAGFPGLRDPGRLRAV